MELRHDPGYVNRSLIFSLKIRCCGRFQLFLFRSAHSLIHSSYSMGKIDDPSFLLNLHTVDTPEHARACHAANSGLKHRSSQNLVKHCFSNRNTETIRFGRRRDAQSGIFLGEVLLIVRCTRSFCLGHILETFMDFKVHVHAVARAIHCAATNQTAESTCDWLGKLPTLKSRT